MAYQTSKMAYETLKMAYQTPINGISEVIRGPCESEWHIRNQKAEKEHNKYSMFSGRVNSRAGSVVVYRYTRTETKTKQCRTAKYNKNFLVWPVHDDRTAGRLFKILPEIALCARVDCSLHHVRKKSLCCTYSCTQSNIHENPCWKSSGWLWTYLAPFRRDVCFSFPPFDTRLDWQWGIALILWPERSHWHWVSKKPLKLYVSARNGIFHS